MIGYAISPWLFAALMFAGMLIFLEIGRRIGVRWLAVAPDKAKPSFASVEAPIYALFGLLIAFTFSGAPARLDTRRQQIVQEANAIQTAYFRIDLLSPDAQPVMRQMFRDYVDGRLLIYRKLPDIDAAMAEFAKSGTLQKQMWTEAIAVVDAPGAHPEAGKMFLPAINTMIEITETRLVSAQIHPPFVLFILLFLLALVISMLSGFGMADHPRKSWLHLAAYALIPVVVVFVVLEIEYPRMGLLPVVTSFDTVLVDVRNKM